MEEEEERRRRRRIIGKTPNKCVCMEKELRPQITDNSRTALVLKNVVIECVNP